jgi:hypothetical protein
VATTRTKAIVAASVRRSLGASALGALAVLTTPGWAIDTPNERITLVGLTGVHVVLDEVGDAGERLGLNRARLQADADQRLRGAGLRVLTPNEALTSVGRPTLHLRLIVLPVPDTPGLYVYSVDVTLRQQVRLVRDRAIESYALTWSEQRVVGAARADRLGVARAALLGKVDEFVTAWRVSNQERY